MNEEVAARIRAREAAQAEALRDMASADRRTLEEVQALVGSGVQEFAAAAIQLQLPHESHDVEIHGRSAWVVRLAFSRAVHGDNPPIGWSWILAIFQDGSWMPYPEQRRLEPPAWRITTEDARELLLCALEERHHRHLLLR